MTIELSAIRERASDPRAPGHHGPCSAPVCGSRVCQTARDRLALLAAVEAVLAKADLLDRLGARHPGSETGAVEVAAAHEVRAAVAAHVALA